MNLSHYFDPVSLDKPENQQLSEKAVFCRNIFVHTPDTPVGKVSEYDIALAGLPDGYDDSVNTAKASSRIRNRLYQLFRVKSKQRIIDLGNLKPGRNKQDAFYAVRDVMETLFDNGLITIFFGGSQELTYGCYLSYEVRNKPFNFVTVDPRLDMGIIDEQVKPESYLVPIMSRNREILFNYTNIGHQKYFVDQQDLDYLGEHYFRSVRLGEVRQNPGQTEPILRDANLISIDLNAVRQSDAPGTTDPSPNGLHGEEICQLSRYAGLSNSVNCYGIYNYAPEQDNRDQTAHLAAQMIWYFIEGIAQRIVEHPGPASKDYKKYIVHMNNPEQDIIFYKSLVTERWWFEVPLREQPGNHPRSRIMSCSHDDYQRACNKEIPDRWWQAYRRFS